MRGSNPALFPCREMASDHHRPAAQHFCASSSMPAWRTSCAAMLRRLRHGPGSQGHFECRRMETAFGEKYLIARADQDKHTAHIEEVRPVATGRDEPRH